VETTVLDSATGSGTTTTTTTTAVVTKAFQVPLFIEKGRLQRPVEVTEQDKKSVMKMKIVKPKKGDNSSLNEYLLMIDFMRHIQFSQGDVWARTAIRNMTADLPLYFKGFVNSYLQELTVYWDEFITKFYDQFFDPNELTAQTDLLNGAKQEKDQKVQEFANYIKSTAVRANITDTKQLGQILYKGLLTELHR